MLLQDNATDTIHLYFIDFKAEAAHSVFHATCGGLGSLPNFAYKNVALEEPGKVRFFSFLFFYFPKGPPCPRCAHAAMRCAFGNCSCFGTSCHLV